MSIRIVACLVLLLVPIGTALAERPAYPWLGERSSARTIADVPPPAGFDRLTAAPGSFAAWLRGLPLLPEGSPVRLHDGRLKANQGAHWAVVDLDVGRGDLQQCADAVIRLRAEFLLATGCDEAIAFHFTSGDLATFAEWRQGLRPVVEGSSVRWQRSAATDGSYAALRSFLDTVFTYAGTRSLAAELKRVDPLDVGAGDVFIQPGSPGHAVLVVDVAVRGSERRFLLAQSYMPAQQVHLLRGPQPGDPWYAPCAEGQLHTPEWTFDCTDLKRFPETSCDQSMR